MAIAEASIAAHLLAAPHHDGSEGYVVERPDGAGGEAIVRLRVPRGVAVDAVGLRHVEDGEARFVRAQVDAETATETWWRAAFRAVNSATRYRWLITGGDVGYAWVNGCGVVPHDVPDADDFVLSLDPGGPAWHLGSVVYEIFPDRFASSGLAVEPPPWAVARAWDERPTGRGKATQFEWFGGDLHGIERRLDHVESIGANVLYLTPFFPAGSTHRYDAASFDRVDPLLGGDEALAGLLRAAHGRGLRVVGDLTANHTGVGHEWFRAREPFYYFDDALPYGYASWLGVKSLPTLDWGSAELRRRIADVVARWLEFGLDGWRIDVANMTGRYGEIDLNAEAARAVRRAAGDALVVAEHYHDHRPDLGPGGWHGAMNYAGFLRPAWQWLRGDEAPSLDQVPLHRLDGQRVVAAMRAFRAGVPWQSVLHSWTLLDSHDTARFRTVAGSRARHAVGVGLQMTTPGVPMVFAGDELGLEGAWGEDARRTMPWDRPETWDTQILETYRRLAALRRSSEALASGGMRYAYVDADAIAYLRESAGERLLCLASRAEHEPVRLPLAALGCTALEPLGPAEALVDDGWAALPADGPEFHVWRMH